MKNLTTILTPTYNKEKYFPQTIESVLKQTRKDWRWWIVLNCPTEETKKIACKLMEKDQRVTVFTEDIDETKRYQIYYPAIIMEKYYSMIATKYVYFLSDDDLLEPDCLENLAGALDKSPQYDVVYGMCKLTYQTEEGWRIGRTIGDQSLIYTLQEGRKEVRPCDNIDGGQILQTRKSHEKVKGWKFPLSFPSIVDGLYMNELAKHFPFNPIDKLVMTKRTLYISENATPAGQRRL